MPIKRMCYAHSRADAQSRSDIYHRNKVSGLRVMRIRHKFVICVAERFLYNREFDRISYCIKISPVRKRTRSEYTNVTTCYSIHSPAPHQMTRMSEKIWFPLTVGIRLRLLGRYLLPLQLRSDFLHFLTDTGFHHSRLSVIFKKYILSSSKSF